MKIQAKQGFIEGAWVQNVAVDVDEAGRIRGIERGIETGPDALGMLLPAPLNLHSHAFQRAMAGLTETRGPDPRDSFWTWRRLMYRFLERLTPERAQIVMPHKVMPRTPNRVEGFPAIDTPAGPMLAENKSKGE